MTVLNKDQVLAAVTANRKAKDVHVERLGGTVRIREMSTAEMLDFRKRTREMEDEESGMFLVSLCWVDEDGARMFDGDNALEEMGALPVEVLNELSAVVLQVNGIGQDAEQEAGKD